MFHTVFITTLLTLHCLLCSTVSFADDTAPQVYKLSHQTADALLPVINSVLRANESVNVYNNDLVVNASSETHQKVQLLLEQLDNTQRNLMISIRNNNGSTSARDNSGVSGGIRTGNVYLGSGQPIVRERGLTVRHDGAQIHTSSTTTQSSSESSQQVRVIEGYPSWISAGQSAPVQSYDRYGNRSTQYVNADQGFYVTARLVGGRVMLEISATNDKFSSTQRGVIDTQQVHTNVSGAVGEWIPLGTIQTNSRDRTREITSRERNTGSSVTDISVRVVPVD